MGRTDGTREGATEGQNTESENKDSSDGTNGKMILRDEKETGVRQGSPQDSK